MYPHLKQFETRNAELERRLEHMRIARERGQLEPARSRSRLLTWLFGRYLNASPETTRHAKETL